jgi:hypothetical protein
MNDSMELQIQEIEEARPALIEELCKKLMESEKAEPGQKKRGRPQQVEWMQIALGVLVSVLYGMSNYQQLWRRLRRKELAGYGKIQVKDDAIIKRLKQAGTEPFERLFKKLGEGREEVGNACTLAPLAPEIAAIDEMSAEQMQRHLKA